MQFMSKIVAITDAEIEEVVEFSDMDLGDGDEEGHG